MNAKAQIRAYFDEQLEASARRYQLCYEDGREDEANFEKIAGSVIHIFQTLYEISLKQGDHKSQQRFMLKQFQQISSPWRCAYQQAKDYDDSVKMLHESIKIRTAEQLCQTLQKIWEEQL